MKVVLPEGAGNAQGDSPCETGRAQERCTAPGGIRAALRLLPAEASGDRAPWRRLHLVLHRRPLRQAGLFHRRGPSRRSREEGGLHRRARLGLRRLFDETLGGYEASWGVSARSAGEAPGGGARGLDRCCRRRGPGRSRGSDLRGQASAVRDLGAQGRERVSPWKPRGWGAS